MPRLPLYGLFAALLLDCGTTRAETLVIFQENFDGPSGADLAGRVPAVHLTQPGESWLADGILKADGEVDDGTNTDRGASVFLGPDFEFLPDSTYTLTLGWTDLENAVVFAGFSTAPPDVNSQMQTQGTNFAARARRIAAGSDVLGAWQAPGNQFTAGGTATPAAGNAVLTLETRSLSDAVFSVDGATRTVDLSAGYRHLWIGYEDPISGTSNARFTGLTLEGPPPPEPPTDLPTVTILPQTPLIPPGTLIELAASVGDAPIFYTLDGSTPDSGSTPYGGPFPLGSSATVRAVALDGDGLPGPVATRNYTVSEPIGTPNLLVVVGDSVGFGDLHSYGGVNIATPALDSLAYEGIRFTQFTTAGPGAHAGQFALLTGRVAARSGMVGAPPAAGVGGWGSEEWSLAEMLRRRGYATAFIGEWLLGETGGSHPNDQGFQLFHGLPLDHSLSPPRVENRGIVDPSPDPATLLDALTTRATDYLGSVAPPFAMVFQPPPLPAAGSSLAGPHGNRVEALDQAVGQLLTALDNRSLADDTLVIFLGNGGAPRTADGGSNGIFRDGKGTTWEGGLRAPLLARLPGSLPAGQNNLSLVWMPDLMPTLAALVGGTLASDRPIDGGVRIDALTGASTRPAETDTAFGYRFDAGAWEIASVRRGKWKSHLLIGNIDPENHRPTTGSQLYDLHVDAEERLNRAAENPGLVADLANLATAAETTLPATGTTDLPEPKEALEDGASAVIEPGPAAAVRYQFIRPEDSIDDHYHIEHSADLIDWDSVVISGFIDAVTPLAGQREEIRLRVPLGAPPFDGERRFLRLSATRPGDW